MKKLEKELTARIARLHGVEPEDVTLDFIQKHREALYARESHEIDDATEYGGYNGKGLSRPNRFERERSKRRADAFLASVE